MVTNYIKHYPLSLLTVVAVLALSLLPIGRVELVEDVPLADKWTHMVMYGGLTAVIWAEYARRHRRACWTRLLTWGVAAPIVLGGVLELMQKYCTTYRSGEWLDFAADSLGTCVGALSGCLFIYLSSSRD